MQEMLPIISSKEELSTLPEGAKVNTASGTTLIPMESLMNEKKSKDEPVSPHKPGKTDVPPPSSKAEPFSPHKPGKTDVPPPSSKAEVTDCGIGMKWCDSYERCINVRRECPSVKDDSMASLKGISSKMELETLSKGQVRPCPGALTWCPAYDTCFPPQLCPRGSKPEDQGDDQVKQVPVKDGVGVVHVTTDGEEPLVVS
jgi:hypothetical protein